MFNTSICAWKSSGTFIDTGRSTPLISSLLKIDSTFFQLSIYSSFIHMFVCSIGKLIPNFMEFLYITLHPLPKSNSTSFFFKFDLKMHDCLSNLCKHDERTYQKANKNKQPFSIQTHFKSEIYISI